MGKYLSSATDKILLSKWARFLETQAELCIRKELDCMLRLGLSQSDTPLLDFGCGVGAYTLRLRRYLPNSRFVAVDINEKLLQKFRNKLESNPDPLIEILHWDIMKDGNHAPIDACEVCVVRLVLQHIPDPKSVLVALRKILRKGTKLFIIEEDDGFFRIYPELASFDKIVDVWKNYGRKYVNNRFLGREIPHLLAGAGFEKIRSEIVGHTNSDWGMENTIDFYIKTLRLIHSTDPDIIKPEEIEKIEKDFIGYKEKYRNNCLIVYPQVITASEFP